MDAILRMLVSVLSALAISAAIFIGLNLLIDRTQKQWQPNSIFLGLGMGGVVGAVLGLLPSFFGASQPYRNAAIAAAVFAVIGAVLVSVLGKDEASRNRVTGLTRTGVFFGPAVLFLSFTLIVPAIKTLGLSLRDGPRGEQSWSFAQFTDIFTDDAFFSLDGIGDIFTSRLTIAAVWAVALALIAGLASTQSTLSGSARQNGLLVLKAITGLILAIGTLMVLGLIEGVARDPNESAIFDFLTVVVSSRITLAIGVVVLLGAGAAVFSSSRGTGVNSPDYGAPQASSLLMAGFILFLLGVFSTLTGVIWNNLWWVAAVAGLSTVFGLMLAVLADKSKRETIAKALIFMPMAISMVGAAVIWDFMYQRDLAGDQTGLFNAVLTGLGFEARGFFINASLIPWNNFFIMIIMIWIQTGFALVILSAALKGVPTEYIEAARVDGATEVQTFWRIILPSIMPTIFVVLTTLIITVMKVFDLVKATTNGANGTDVLANTMFNDLRIGNFNRSAAFAVLIFALVLPVMVYNVRRTASEVM